MYLIEFFLEIYFLLGFISLFLFHFYLLNKLDSNYKNGSLGFKFAISPGLLFLWPVIYFKYFNNKENLSHEEITYLQNKKYPFIIGIGLFIIPISIIVLFFYFNINLREKFHPELLKISEFK